MLASFALAVAGASPSQVLILGPHHTGTSIVSRALSLQGLHLGERPELLLDPENPLKFWERRDVVALNKRTGKRSIIRLARGTVMSDVFAAYAQHTKSDTKKLVFVRGDGTEKGKSLSPKARVADLRGPAAAMRTPARTPRKKREPKKSFDEQIWNRAVAIGHDAWDEKHFGSLDAGESVALPLNRAEIRPDVEYMELSIDLGEEPPPVSESPLRSLRKQASRVTGVTGAFSGKSPE